jgi:hypothetical protein
MIRFILIPSLLLCLLAEGCTDKPQEIVVCGDDQVLIIDKSKSDSVNITVNWRWKVSDARDLPAEYQKYLVPTDECKPVDYNSKILVTSSGGGVVLIDRQTRKPVFYAHVPNAHSAELLPGNRLVVALSTAVGGNSIQLFNISEADEVVFKDSLYSGHGVVWIDDIKRLFALGYDELRSYSLKDWNTEKPALRLEKRWNLPDDSGHNLSYVTDNSLVISTHHNVWIFDIPSENFTPFTPLEGVENVKSVNVNPKNGEVVYTKGEISWWTHNIYLKNPDKKIVIPEINIYKVRVISN